VILGRRARRRAAQIAEARRQGYSQGILAAAVALMTDLERLGRLDDAEVVQTGEDGGKSVCSTCSMRRMGYADLATRTEFAIGVRDGGG
jgi:hypothetical protein